MNETISATAARRQFSKILRAVAAGGNFTVTVRGVQVARICPVEASQDQAKAQRRAALDELLERLRHQPALNLPKVTRDEIYEL